MICRTAFFTLALLAACESSPPIERFTDRAPAADAAAAAENPAQDARDFTDERLEVLLKTQSQGAIFVWSPAMPLSVKALEHIKAAAAQAELPLTVLVDQRAKYMDPAGLAQATTQNPVEFDYLAASALIKARMTMHFPTVIYFSDGKLSPRTLVGYKETAEYLSWFKRKTIRRVAG